MSKPIIAVDIDDVLAAEAEFIIEYSNKHWGHKLTVDDYQEHWQDMWQVDHDELLRRADELHQPGTQNKYKLIDGAHEALKKLSQSYKLVAITSRKAAIRDETIEWISRSFEGLISDYYFTGFWDAQKIGGHLLTKGDMVKEIGADYLIDDQPKHCIAAAEAGIKSILFGDYKIGRHLELREGVVRCKDWQAVEEYFDGER